VSLALVKRERRRAIAARKSLITPTLGRCGELLREIEASKGGRPKTGAETDTSLRKQAAEEAGLSTRQVVTAMRVGNVPREEFERQVESANPPTAASLFPGGKRFAPHSPLLTGPAPGAPSRSPCGQIIHTSYMLLRANGEVLSQNV
jgi:hypothetical protein